MPKRVVQEYVRDLLQGSRRFRRMELRDVTDEMRPERFNIILARARKLAKRGVILVFDSTPSTKFAMFKLAGAEAEELPISDDGALLYSDSYLKICTKGECCSGLAAVERVLNDEALECGLCKVDSGLNSCPKCGYAWCRACFCAQLTAKGYEEGSRVPCNSMLKPASAPPCSHLFSVMMSELNGRPPPGFERATGPVFDDMLRCLGHGLPLPVDGTREEATLDAVRELHNLMASARYISKHG